MKKGYCHDFWRLLFPKVCICCGNFLVETESEICLDCWADLPRTHFHERSHNPIEELFWGRVPIVRATAWCSYSKGGKVQNLLYALKYKNHPSVGVYLGQCMAHELQPWLDSVEAIIPVPLHPAKLRQRGYNQSERIAYGLSQVLSCPVYAQALQRSRANLTQTRKAVYERWENAHGLFSLNQEAYPSDFWKGKRVVLVDDVITTGATLEACAEALVQVGAEVQILAVAASLPENF